jgi:hypothetical protein
MTWREFVELVNEALVEYGIEDAPIAYFDFSYPTKEHRPSVVLGDAGLVIL